MMSEENRLSPDNGKEDETPRTKDCSNRDSESRDQAKHRNSSTEPHCRPEIYPRQLRKEGEQNRSDEYSLKLWRYLSAWINGQNEPFRKEVDEMIEYIKNNSDSLSLATNKHDQNSPMLLSCPCNEVPKLSIEAKDSGKKYNPSNVLDKDLVAPGPSHATCDVCYRGESHKGESRYSTFEPAVTIGYIQDDAQEHSYSPSVDTVPIHGPTIHETENNSLTLFDDAVASADPSRFICDQCKEVFQDKEDFANHNCKFTREDKEYTCEYCDKSFKYKSYLARHYWIHADEKPHQCDKCGKSFSTKSHLKRHHEGCGSTDKSYTCKECHKKYLHKQDLVIHFRKHTGEKPYECVKCGKSFSDPACFSKHKKSCGRSADDRPFACDKCNKKFNRKYHLDRHSLIHSGEKLYGCIKCGKNFSTKGNLRKHEKGCDCSLQSKQ